MADTTNPLPSIQEPVVDKKNCWSPIWYKWIKPLMEMARQTASGVERVVEEINQAAGQWSVSVNDNGRVIGAVRLDGGAETTEFGVLADRFVVVHPAANNTTIQAFVVGIVDGVLTVGIDGFLIVDGSITTPKLHVELLSAISGNIGTITAGTVSSGDGRFTIDLNAKSIVMST